MLHAELSAPRLAAPGLLAQPLNWTFDALRDLMLFEPALLATLLEADHRRLHLFAFALAHTERRDAEFARLLAHAPLARIVLAVLPAVPRGLARALGRLPDVILPAPRYRELAAVLDDALLAKAVHHAGRLRGGMIHELAMLPADLRGTGLVPLALTLAETPGNLSGAIDLLVERAGIARDDLAARMAAAPRPSKARAVIRALLDCLPADAPTPPARIGPARRVDSAAELRAAGRRLRNCLTLRADDMVTCPDLIYLWEEEGEPTIVCEVERIGRWGWLLGQIAGPANEDLSLQRFGKICDVFAAHGIRHRTVTATIERLSRAGGGHGRRPVLD